MKISQAEKLGFEQLKLEKTNVKAEKELKTHGIKIQTKPTGTSYTKQGNIPSIKLLKLELTRFDKDILKWQEFWDSFDASIHKSSSLEDVDKLNYLKGLPTNKATNVLEPNSLDWNQRNLSRNICESQRMGI